MTSPEPAEHMPPDPDTEQREAVEHQGNVVFWMTLVVGLLILVISAIYALVL